MLDRKGNNSYELCYSEFFSYLPDHALKMARETAIQILQQLGTPPDKIIPVKNGVKIQKRGDSQIVLSLILELLSQIESRGADVQSKLDFIMAKHQLFTALIDIYWNWNEDTEHKYNVLSSALTRVQTEHPTFSEEIDNLIMKYNFKSEKTNLRKIT